MGKCYNIVCDSSNNFYSQNTGSQTTFFFDWSKLPNKMYKIKFSYMSDDISATLSPVMALWADFNGSSTTYNAGNGTDAVVGFLGNVFPDKHGANAYYSAKYNDNPPVMCYKPNNNFFTITLRNALTNTLYTTPTASQYILMLNFEEVDYD